MSVMGRPSWEAWISEYSKSHQHPANRTCHTIGIPMIAVSMAILPATFFVGAVWKGSLALFVIGWAFQFIGHAFEGKPPEFLKDWRFLFVGLRWWFAKVQGKA